MAQIDVKVLTANLAQNQLLIERDFKEVASFIANGYHVESATPIANVIIYILRKEAEPRGSIATS